MDERALIKLRPYQYITDYAESLYPQTGKKVFEILTLMPVSLIIPDLPYENKKVRSNINALFLAPSGSGKTSLSDLFASFTYYPLKLESITAAKLESTIMQMPMFSMIVGDFARMSKDPIVIKTIEGLLGEEKRLMRKTMRKDIESEVEGIGLLCGVATDLHFYVLGGIIFRVVPILLGHDAIEHSDIGKHIMSKIGGNGVESTNKEQIIKDFYMELASIQAGEHKEYIEKHYSNENIEPIPEVIGYEISEDFRLRSYQEWDNLTKMIVKEIGFNWFREYQEFYRFLIAHAFLNVFNRKVENGILYPNEEDFNMALSLMKRTIVFKYRLLKTEQMAKGIANAKQFQEILKSDKIPEETKKILRNIIRIKSGGKTSVG